MNPKQKSIVIWSVIAFGLAIISVTFNNSAMVLRAGFFAKFFAVIAGTLLGLAGAMIGDAIRRFALPEQFFTTGGVGSILKTKIFWMVGPQTVGVVIGVCLGAALVLK